MPTVTNDVLTKYPKGVFLGENELAIPDGLDFVFAPAADGIRGSDISNLGEYVFPNFSKQVQAAYDKGVLMGALFTLRVDGNNYPMDFPNPDKDRQLQGFLHAVKNKTYAMWGMMVVTSDSPAATITAITNFGNNLRARTGKRGFLMVSQAMWEGARWNPAWSDDQHREFASLLQNEIGHKDYSKWSLLIIGRYNVPEGGKVYTPGNFGITNERNVIWENQPRKYIMWMGYTFNAQFLGVEWPGTPAQPPTNDDPQDPPANDDDTTGDTTPTIDGTLLERIAVAEERQAAALEKIAAFFEKVFK